MADTEAPTNVFIQWKGTNVCLDFWCECGFVGHIDAWFVYSIQCPDCEKRWAMPCSQEPYSLELVPYVEHGPACEPVVPDRG